MYTYLAETEHSFLVSVALAITLSMFIYTFCFFLYTHILSTTLSTHASPTPLQPTSLHCSYFFFIFIIFYIQTLFFNILLFFFSLASFQHARCPESFLYVSVSLSYRISVCNLYMLHIREIIRAPAFLLYYVRNSSLV